MKSKQVKIFVARYALLPLTLAITAGAWRDLISAQRPAPDTPAQQQGQQETPSIKLDTDLVSLSVTVTDQKGQAVTGLKKEDFKVYENGVEQPINFFTAEERPASWGLVLDRSGSMEEMIGDVYRAAIHVIDEGTEQDEMCIVTFDSQTELVCDLTTDQHRLENSILGLRAGGATALWDAGAFALDQIRRGKHQKKVLVMITDGEDNSSRLSFRRLIERVEERNVLIYTVGMFESMDGWRPGMKAGGARGELEKLAEVTGAFAHFPTDIKQCRQTMKDIAREVSRQYSLGYYPSNTARDGKWRKIRVSASREGSGTGYVARTRAGYYAPNERENDKSKRRDQ